MQARIKWGLIVGAVCFVLNIAASLIFGPCGVFITLLGGAAAGYLAARDEAPAAPRLGAQAGAIAGAIVSGIGVLAHAVAGIANFSLYMIFDRNYSGRPAQATGMKG